jgi:hypothetical protein
MLKTNDVSFENDLHIFVQTSDCSECNDNNAFDNIRMPMEKIHVNINNDR